MYTPSERERGFCILLRRSPKKRNRRRPETKRSIALRSPDAKGDLIFLFSPRRFCGAEDAEIGADGQAGSSYGLSFPPGRKRSFLGSFAKEGGDPGGKDQDREQNGQGDWRQKPGEQDPGGKRQRRHRRTGDRLFAAFHIGTFFPFTGYARGEKRVPTFFLFPLDKSSFSCYTAFGDIKTISN